MRSLSKTTEWMNVSTVVYVLSTVNVAQWVKEKNREGLFLLDSYIMEGVTAEYPGF